MNCHPERSEGSQLGREPVMRISTSLLALCCQSGFGKINVAAPRSTPARTPGKAVSRFSAPTICFYDLRKGVSSVCPPIPDGDGNRVQKSASGLTLYWYGATGNVLAETSSTGALLSEYVFFNGKRVARRDADNTVKFYYSDALGSASVIAVVKNNVATILAESDYLPYGGEIPIITGDPNHYKFTGKERDLESGLDNFGARYNASSLGRFMTPDCAAKATSVPYASFGDPQTLNLYSYVENEPLDRIDADGHDEIGHSPVEGIPYFCSSAGGTSTVQCREKTFNVHSSNDVAQAAQNPPPPPHPPGLTGEAKKEFLRGMDHRKVGKRTVASLAKTLTHEHRGLSGGKPGELQRGITEEAHAIYNSASLKHPNPMALPNVTATAEDKQIMEETYFNRGSGGDDPVEGRTYFGNSAEDLNSRPIGDSRQTVYDSAGPFDWGSHAPQYIYIYNDPGH